MSKPAPTPDADLVLEPDVSHLVTEDDTPVDNIFSEKQQRLLTEPLYSSWTGPGEGRAFLAAANVGLFPSIHRPPLVPDVFLSLDVQVGEEWWAKRNRSYFVWEFGKVPEVVIEVVSNTVGNETGSKLADYARIRVPYYVIFDPQGLVQATPLCVFELQAGRYMRRTDGQMPETGLGLVLWKGLFEGSAAEWLRFCDDAGALIPTGAERADAEGRRAEAEGLRADAEGRRAVAEGLRADAEGRRAVAEGLRADAERLRAERLAARLRSMGLDPDAEG